MEFVWYDYETWGNKAKFHRPYQVAAIRTDSELKQIGTELVAYCRPREDCLISPKAVEVNRKTPQEVMNLGESEAEFARRIHQELTRRTNTCVIGYNAMKFDHEVTRYLFYRNLRDPYTWHWDRDNSRMDLMFLVCAVRLVKPGALKVWPDKDNGRPSFKLVDLVQGNVEKPDGMAHDALADTRNMLDLARIIKKNSPKLFAHAMKMRRWQNVENECHDSFLYVSPSIRQKGRYATILTRIGPSDRKKKRFWSFDLSRDPARLQKPFASWSNEDLDHAWRCILQVKTNAAPFVWHCPLPAQTPRAVRTLERMKLTSAKVEANLKKLRSNLEPIHEYCASQEEEWAERDGEPVDADDALYSGKFWEPYQFRQMRDVIAAGSEARLWQRDFDDPRLEALVFRYRARNFPHSLTEADQSRWHKYCRGRQRLVSGKFNPAKKWKKKLRKLKANPANATLAEALEDWHARLKDELALD